jgi:hypothetical protein
MHVCSPDHDDRPKHEDRPKREVRAGDVKVLDTAG